MARQKRKASGFDENHPFWPMALELWQSGHSNAQVATQARAEGFDLDEDQVRYARNRNWSADALPARGAAWLRGAVREATEVYPNASGVNSRRSSTSTSRSSAPSRSASWLDSPAASLPTTWSWSS